MRFAMYIYFEAYGCTLNSGEAEKMKELARASGHVITSDADESDISVLVTCTVIEPTELKMVRRIKALASENRTLVVAGCMAAVSEEQIMEEVPDAVLIPTPGQVEGFSEFLKAADKLNLKEVESERVGGEERKRGREGEREITDISAPIPIAEGCLGSCAYCITNLARGRLRSYPVDEILGDISSAVNKGKQEIRLTAQDSANFGTDMDDGMNLPELLEMIGSLEKTKDTDFKVRVGMMNPNSVKPIIAELIEAFRKPHIFKFLHLPVQSGSNSILKSMNRNYEVELFKTIVCKFRDAFPGLTLSTDIIVGFPGETEADHSLTKELIAEVRPNIVNITRFSERPGTPAVKMDGKLHGRVLKARSRELTELCQAVSLKNNQALIGNNFRVLAVERDISHYKNTTLARTDEYKPVVIESELELGKLYDVKIISVNESYLVGDIIK
jgi:MiaB-like tRNA modifying enzyme